MDRRSLILRRFGSLDFGLGYFEGDVWIDHTTLSDGGVGLGIDDGPLAAVHELMECCAGGLRPMPVEVTTLAATVLEERQHVQPVARRSSAG